MARIVKRPGDVFYLPLSDGAFGYAQWLSDGTARFFSITSEKPLPIEEVLSSPIAFRVAVFNDTPRKFGWAKLGRADIPAAFSAPQRYAKRDIISGALSSYFEGVETPAGSDELAGLETLAVWAHHHIVERLEAHLSGRESEFLRSVRIVQ